MVRILQLLKGMGAKRLVSCIGTVLMVVSLYFLGRRLFEIGLNFTLISSPLVVVGLILIAFFEGVGIILASFNYISLIRNLSGIRVDRASSVFAYVTANIYKYIPGSVMYVVGRNRIAMDNDDLGHGKVAFATIVEGLFYIIAAIIVAMLFSFKSLAVFLPDLAMSTWVLIVAAGVVVIFGCMTLGFRKVFMPRLIEFFSTVELLKASVIMRRFGFALAMMFFWGSTFAATMLLLGQPMYIGLAVRIVGLYLLSWLAGFMTPGAPSGLGVREAVMAMFLGGMVDEGVLLAAMVLHRLLNVVGDVFAYVMGIVFRNYTINGHKLP